MLRISLVLSVLGALCLPGVARAQSSTPGDSTDSLPARPPITTTTTFTQADLQELPIDEPLQAFGFAPGVVERSGYLGVATPSDFSVQGGPPGDAAFFIDGAPARLETFGGLGIELPLNAIARASLTSGPIGAEVAASQNAVVDIETRHGGQRVTAEARAETDGLFGSGATVGYNRFEASLGGPVPGIAGLTWFAAGSGVGQQSRYRGLGAGSVPTYVPFGTDTTVTVPVDAGFPLTDSMKVAIPTFAQWGGQCGGVGNPNTTQGQQITANYGQACQGLNRPRDWTSDLRGIAKVRFAYGTGSNLSLTGAANVFQQRNFPAAEMSAPGLQTGMRRTAHLLVANWRQALGRFHGGPVALHVNVSSADIRVAAGALTAGTEATTRSPSLGIETTALQFFGADSVPLSNIDQLIFNMRENVGLRVPFLLRQDLRPSQPYRFNPYGTATGWPTTGSGAQLVELDESHAAGSVDLQWRPNPEHDLRLGVDFSRGEIAYFTSGMVTSLTTDLFHVRPRRLGVFVTDHVRMRDLDLSLGIRHAQYTPGGEFLNVPGRTFTLPGGWGDTTAAGYAASVARYYHLGATQNFWLPSVRLGASLGPATHVRAGFARSVIAPDVGDQFTGNNTDASISGTPFVWGRDVAYIVSNVVEAGLTQTFGRLAFDGSIYHTTAANAYLFNFAQYYDSATGGVINGFALMPYPQSLTGVDLAVAWTPSPELRGAVTYSYASHDNHFGGQHLIPGQDIAYPGPSTHAISLLVTVAAPNRRTGLLGTLTGGMRAALAARLVSGDAYTPCYNSGTGQLASTDAICTTGYELGPINSAHIPWTKLLDLRITKRIAGFGGHWSAFLDVRNLLNAENLTNAFVETGTDTNQAYEAFHFVQPAINQLSGEAPSSAHLPNGAIDLRTCQGWTSSTQIVDCYALRQTENRFGNGDGVFTLAEQTAAFGAYFDFLYGPWAFHGPGRTARVGVRLEF